MVQEGIEGCKVARQRLEVAGFTIINRGCQFAREILLGSECVVCRVGRELDIKVVERSSRESAVKLLGVVMDWKNA